MNNADKTNPFYPSSSYLNTLPQRELRQLRFIITGNLTFMIGFLLIGLTLFFQGLPAVSLMCISISCCFIVSLIFIKKDNLYTGVTVSTVGIIIAVLIICFFAGNYESSLIYYRNACFVVTMAICNQLVTLKKRQLYYFYAGSGSIWLVYVITTIGAHLKNSFLGTISAVVICSISIIVANTVILFLNNFNLQLVKTAIESEKKAEDNLNSITQIISDSKDGLALGERLYDATQKASGSISELNRIYNVISEGSSGLTEEASTINNASSSVKMQAQQMKDSVQLQNESIAATSASMQKITGNLAALSTIADNHRNTMNDVVQNLNNQVDQIKRLVDEVARVQASSTAISQFVQTVDGIASRTGLLAMNASIEAAHVGQQGKGFVVIAQEIRKLSSETTLNSAKISDGLSENNEIVQETAESVAGFQKFTQKTTDELKKTIYAIEEILAGILTINEDAQTVMGALEQVVAQTRSTNTIVDNVVTEIESQSVALSKMATFTNTLNDSVSGMEDRVNEIKDVLEGIENEAKENVAVTRKITDSLES